jgi:hypothetical protein
MSHLVIKNTTYVIENDIGIHCLSAFFSTPWLILKHECSWNGHQVKWVQVDTVNQTYQESANWPRWIRILVAILLLIPASLGRVLLNDKSKSHKYWVLKEKLLQENEKKHIAHYCLAQIKALPSTEDNWGALSIFPKDTRQIILLKTLKMNPSFKERAVLSSVNKASYQFFNGSRAWNITTRHLGLKMKPTSADEEFSIYRNRLICQHALLEKQCQDLKSLFDIQNKFLQLPIIYDQFIANDLSKPIDLNSEKMIIQSPSNALLVQLKALPRKTSLVRIITSRGYNAFAIRCKEKFPQPISFVPSSWMFCYIAYIKCTQTKLWMATVASEFKDNSSIKRGNSFISFKPKVFEEQTEEVKRLFEGEFCQIRSQSHFLADWHPLSWEIARD